ncbi:MAG TPA: hypothetical protein VGX76_00910 [Pirellulales bacterium]|jgi:hypothetical protein|nr:hypothetical protein [Pirellulales bacterium]
MKALKLAIAVAAGLLWNALANAQEGEQSSRRAGGGTSGTPEERTREPDEETATVRVVAQDDEEPQDSLDRPDELGASSDESFDVDDEPVAQPAAPTVRPDPALLKGMWG